MTLNVTGSVVDNTDNQTLGGKKTAITQAATLKAQGRVTVQSGEVDINESAAITAGGWVAIKNAGSTDRIDIGFATATYDMSLEPGESSVFRIISTGSARLFVKAEASSDTNNFEYAFYEL